MSPTDSLAAAPVRRPGTRSVTDKLTEANVREIREMVVAGIIKQSYGPDAKKVAQTYGISLSHARHTINGSGGGHGHTKVRVEGFVPTPRKFRRMPQRRQVIQVKTAEDAALVAARRRALAASHGPFVEKTNSTLAAGWQTLLSEAVAAMVREKVSSLEKAIEAAFTEGVRKAARP